MVWRKDIYESLVSCATLCDKFATTHSEDERIEDWYRSIFLSLDCADVCRQLSILYVRGSENTYLLAKACSEVCRKCADEVNRFDADSCNQLYMCCQQAICSCIKILNMTNQEDILSKNMPGASASLFYGIDLRETLYN